MVESGRAASVDFCLACDDVRKEVSGKDTLVGVYSGDFVVEALPATLIIALYLGLTPSQLGTQHLRLRVLFNENSHFEVAANFNIERVGQTVFGTPRMIIPCNCEGELVVQADTGDAGEWTDILRKKVVIQAPAKIPLA